MARRAARVNSVDAIDATTERSSAMNFDYSEADEYDADFAAAGPIEFDEIDEGDAAIEDELLAARIQAARDCGA
jgi:hypothetical protein